jgi:hypothetical protein
MNEKKQGKKGLKFFFGYAIIMGYVIKELRKCRKKDKICQPDSIVYRRVEQELLAA